MAPSATSSTAKDDTWADTAEVYSSQAARLTELHGADLVTILKDDILKASTILDVGCGTGAFAKAYLQQFPKGVPGQTLVLSDLSEGMLQKAKETIKTGPDCLTEFIFQIEDGTKLDGVKDGSVDIVVSLFGVFLIPDQNATLQAIGRVLKSKNGIFANGSWMFGKSDYFVREGFGVSLQDAFKLPNDMINPAKNDEASMLDWGNSIDVQKRLTSYCDPKIGSVKPYHVIHNTVWEFDAMWTMLSKNPMSAVQDASESDAAEAKKALQAFVTQEELGTKSFDSAIKGPMMFTTASILAVARGFGSSAPENPWASWVETNVPKII